VERALGQLEHEPRGVEAGEVEHVADGARFERGKVHVDGVDRAVRRLAAGLGEDLAVDCGDQVGVGVAQERPGAEQAVARVAPARERLHRDLAAAVERDDRLEMGDQLAELERGGELVAAGRGALAGRLHLGEPHAHLALAGVLGAVHRDIGAVQQLAGVDRACGRGRDADAGAHPDLLTVDGDGLGQQVEHAGGDLLAVVVVDVLQQHRELVAAHARGDVARADADTDAPGGGHQHGVARPVAGAVVDRLEVVEVEEQHGRHAAAARQRRLDAAQEQRAVGEPGQRVALRLALEPVQLERQAGVGGERLEQPQVLARE
jgi:hypothetical protein